MVVMGFFSSDPDSCKFVEQGIAKLEIELSQEQINLVLRHLDLLHRWQDLFNLTSIAQEQWVTKHLLDSFSAYKFLPTSDGKPLNCLDIGSGPGFPAVPLAVASGYNWYLLDKNSKKSGFLLRVKLELGLDNINIINSNLEYLAARLSATTHAKEQSVVLDTRQANSFAAEVPLAFDVIIARSAFKEPELLNLSHPLLKTGGILIAMHGKYKGKPQQSKQENKWQLEKFEKIKVPSLNATRHIISWHKLG